MYKSPYDEAFRQTIIKRIMAGEDRRKVRKEMDLEESTLRRWIKKHKDKNCTQSVQSTTPMDNIIPQGIRIAVIADVQAKPGNDFTYLTHVGKYIAAKRPQVIVCIGDFADLPSLSFHDVPGSKNFEGARYKSDILAAHEAMKTLMAPIQEEMKNGWNPRLVLTLGNHENRIDRTINATPKLDGAIGLPDLEYERWGWEVYPFLEPVVIEGVAFCHYFCSGVMGRPITSARAILTKKHMSCFAGHQQGRDIAYGLRGDGKEMTAIICGSCYEHDEDYLNYQTNNHFRGIYILSDVVNGEFEEMPVSLKYLRRKFGQ